MQNEIPDIKNFSSVWERVEASAQIEEDPQIEPARKVEIPIRTRAERFLPKF